MTFDNWQLDMGAAVVPGEGVRFTVWAPNATRVDVEIETAGGPIHCPLAEEDGGIFAGLVPGLDAGALYRYRLDGSHAYPDPYSRCQPHGVHGPSVVVDPGTFGWSDADWHGLGREGLVIYECHVGTATPHGTFEGLAQELSELKRLGISAIEIMPVADFPGRRGWGYDGVDLFAPKAGYGGPLDLKLFVDEAHRHGLGVILDVVYNHLGPDGNYLAAYAREYFTDRYRTPWGDALNFDGPGSRWVRHFVVQNALYWIHEYHVDGLRVDATHAIFDAGPVHILAELTERVRASLPPGRRAVLIAEDNRNDVRFLLPVDAGGLGFDAVWADDFHHAIHAALTGERDGYYEDYRGTLDEVARAIAGGFLYQGEYSPHFGRLRGTPSGDRPASQFVFHLQSHDQVGNRAFGERLNHLVPLDTYRAVSALLLLVPETVMLFQGQEFAATSPFLYFTDHNPDLGRLVREGRRREFAGFAAFADPARREAIPDPQAPATFERSRLHLAERQHHAGVYRLYRDLLGLRRTDPVLAAQDRRSLIAAAVTPAVLALRRRLGDDDRLLLVNLGEAIRLSPAQHSALTGTGGRQIRWHSNAAAYRAANESAGEPAIGALPEEGIDLPARCAVLI
ncbi:MAG: malto-oligosyltrehalose trehalohydrolase [Chloroflexi bacterium]|nr:malto-oligosyltrehalose trehalohydrolase [Chloroflexota bacterium]